MACNKGLDVEANPWGNNTQLMSPLHGFQNGVCIGLCNAVMADVYLESNPLISAMQLLKKGGLEACLMGFLAKANPWTISVFGKGLSEDNFIYRPAKATGH